MNSRHGNPIAVRQGRGLLTAAALLGAAAAAAQGVPGSAAGALEEVVVTAQKREESLQMVPLSVAVLSQQELERSGVFGTRDYATRVPNLSFNAHGSDGRGAADNLVVRGVTGGNTTARYIDDAAVPAGIDLKIVDVARIEVLRGPQGTLYGASSMGGAMKIITNEPALNAASGDVAVRLSNVAEGSTNYRADGIVNVPVVDNVFGLRLVGYYDNESGVFDRIVGSGASAITQKNIDGERDRGAQLKARWAINDRLTVSPRIVYQQDAADGAHFADISPDNFTQHRALGLAEPYSDRLVHSSVNVNYAGDALGVVSATSYTTYHTNEAEDVTDFLVFAFGLPSPIPSPMYRPLDYTVFQQELRVTSTGKGPLGYLAGLYYTDSTSANHYSEFAPGIGALFGIPTDLIYSQDGQTKRREFAGFGEVSYQITDRFKAIVGARWFHATLNASVARDGIVNGGPTLDTGDQGESGVDPKLSLEFAASDSAMLYATAAKGYRPGGVNGGVPTSLCGADLAALGRTSAPATFKSDSLWSYEAGTKTSWLDRRLRLNGALFWIDWTNIQQGVNLACGFPFTDNVGAARSRGAEFELNARPVDALQLSAGLGYTDAVITQGAPGVRAKPGDRIQQVPKFTATAAAEYSWPMASGRSGFLRADYQHQGESFTTFSQTNPERIRAPFNVLNMRLGLQWEAWRAALFADNLTNEHVNFSDTVSLAAEIPGRVRYATNRPRTVGIEAGYRFGR
jgi:iron complex outermembrane receptor protein